MKQIILILLCAVLSLSGCAADSGGAESGIAESRTESQTETGIVPGRTDRDIIDDYKNAVPEGGHDVSVLFMNAGKADSILVSVDGNHFLIDTGTAASVPVILASLGQMNVEKLSGVFITHTDNDHTGGYAAVTEKYPADVLYTSTISSDWNKLKSLCGKDTERVPLDPGSAVELADGVYFTVMGPVRYNPSDDNNNSLVLRLEVNGKTFLFCGDMMHDEETSLIYSGMPLDCDVLKVGYHGNKEATSSKFLEAASPSVAVISTDREEDENSAHKSVVAALEASGADVMVTDEYQLGVLLTVSEDGEIAAEELVPAREAADVRFTEVSKTDQTAVIENRESEAVDISGWYIVSIRGREVFIFPEGSTAAPGETVVVACREYNGDYDYIWEENRVWHKDKKDIAVLYDTWGNRVDEMKSKDNKE